MPSHTGVSPEDPDARKTTSRSVRDTPTDHVADSEVHPVPRQPATPNGPGQKDLFHDAISDEFIAKVFATVAATPQHTYQVLTKRHGRMRSLLSDSGFQSLVIDHWDELREEYPALAADRIGWDWYPLPNVWLGVSVEDQKRADLRIPALLDTPAALRFLSCEPLLGPVDLGAIEHGSRITDCLDGSSWQRGVIGREPVMHARIDWVIVGGESGTGARPMHPEWARSLRDQCCAAGVAFLFKQWGTWRPASVVDKPSRPVRYTEHPAPMVRVGKHAAGRELDGRTWDEFPKGVA